MYDTLGGYFEFTRQTIDIKNLTWRQVSDVNGDNIPVEVLGDPRK